MPLGPGILAFAVCYFVLGVLLGRFPSLALDRPNERSLHERPIPRSGGVAILLGAGTSLAFVRSGVWVPAVLASLLAIVSIIDDLRGLPAAWRLAAHAAAAAVLVWYVLSPMNALELAAFFLAVVWITNLFNFMDGSDGLAGGMALIGFAGYAAGAWLAGNEPLALVSMALAGAAAAFLIYNFHPARIFMGDVGSIPLGFLAAALGIVGWRDDAWPLWFPVLVFAPFIGDATLTLLRRIARRERLWQAHRDHYYQRLVRLGFGHRGTAYIAYALMLACALAALYGRAQRPLVQWAVVAASIVVLAAVAGWIERRWRRRA